MPACIPWLAAVCLAAALLAPAQTGLGELRSVRAWTAQDATRVVVELSRETKWKYGRLSGPERLFIDFLDTAPRLGPRRIHVIEIGDARAIRARVATKDPRTTRLVLDLAGDADFEISHLTNPERLVIELRPREAAGRQRLARQPARTDAGSKTADEAGKTDPVRAPPASTPREAARAQQPPGPGAEAAPPATASASGSQSPVAKDPQPSETLAASRAATPPASWDLAADRAEKSSAKGPAVPAAKAAPAEAGGSAAGIRAEARTALPATEPPRGSGRPAPSPARPMRSGSRTMTRALGLRIGRVVLDPGHGGHDEGSRGPSGLVEKEFVLDVALRLGAMIEERLGGDVVFTRSTDEFIGLEERTAIANEQRADLFLSIHANSSPVKRASGAEVFYLNFTNSKEALDLAARENAGHNKSIFELRELLQKIALSDKLDESREFAGFLQRELAREWRQLNSASRDRGVKTAPFVVLIGASMPSVLAEIGFLSNPRDEALMKKSEYRQRLAEALYRGVERYASSLGQTQALRASTPAPGIQSTR